MIYCGLREVSLHLLDYRSEKSQGNYETINSRVAPGGGEMMIEAAINMLNEIKGKGRYVG